jgi:cyclopropane fatty-acyl-phospholipid synthase-like methyltransferase
MMRFRVKNRRPEEVYTSPLRYFDGERARRYARSGAIRRTQEMHAARIVELLNLAPPLRVLDVGCGPGFSSLYLMSLGFDVTGVDINPHMLDIARGRGVRCIMHDVTVPKPIGEYEAVISVSAVQWFSSDGERARGFVEFLKMNLVEGGCAGIHLHPASSEEVLRFARLFRRGFTGGVHVDNPDDPGRRAVYILLRRA